MLILRRIQTAIVINVRMSSYKVPLLTDFSKTVVFSTDFINIHSVGVELFHADKGRERRTDGRTDKTKLIIALRNFATEPNKN